MGGNDLMVAVELLAIHHLSTIKEMLLYNNNNISFVWKYDPTSYYCTRFMGNADIKLCTCRLFQLWTQDIDYKTNW